MGAPDPDGLHSPALGCPKHFLPFLSWGALSWSQPPRDGLTQAEERRRSPLTCWHCSSQCTPGCHWPFGHRDTVLAHDSLWPTRAPGAPSELLPAGMVELCPRGTLLCPLSMFYRLAAQLSGAQPSCQLGAISRGADGHPGRSLALGDTKLQACSWTLVSSTELCPSASSQPWGLSLLSH